MTTTTSEEHKTSDIKLTDRIDSTANDCNEKVFNAVGFYLYEDKKLKKVSLSLTLKSLVLNADDEIVKTIRMSDILGATFKSGDLQAKKIKLAEDQVLGKDVYVLKLHLLSKPPSKDENAVSKERRKPEPRKYERFLLYSDVQETVIKWKNLILHAANNPEFKNLIQNHNINDLPNFERNLLVFVNFKSGQGKAANYWKKCRKLLVKAGCTINDIMMDEYSKLSNYIEKSSAQELQKFSAIVSVSGDGIPHDLINRFYRRPDQEELIKIPIMLIPGGSCNALTQNILDKSGEDASLEGCCYVLAKGRSIKSDLTLYEREDGLRVYSFLSLTWAAPANIDLDSETLRTLGNVRFDIYGAWEVLTLKKYKAKFSYSETAKKPPDFTQDIKGEDWKTVDEDFSYLSIHNMPWIGMNYEALPMSDLEDGVNYFISIKGEEISRKTLLNTRKFLKPNPKVTSGADLKDLGLSYGKIKSFRLEPYGDRLGKYSIDGEEYEVQRLQGWVIEKGITFVGIPEEHQDHETM